MSKSSSREKFLRQQIHDILLKEWDPIGVQDWPEASDEYDSYIPSVYELLTSRKSEKEIFDYLWQVETEYMGLIGHKKKTEAIAAKLMALI